MENNARKQSMIRKIIKFNSKKVNILFLIVNVVVFLFVTVFFSVFSIYEARLANEQNMIDIKNVSVSAANSVDSLLVARERAVNNAMKYQNDAFEKGTGLDLTEFVTFINGYYTGSNYKFQLIDETYKGYIITNTDKTFVEFDYDLSYADDSYSYIHDLCDDLVKPTAKGVHGFSKEFTDKELGIRSFAYYGVIAIKDSANQQKNYLLMAVVSSEDVISSITNKETYTNLECAVVDFYGNFAISNKKEYTTENIFDDISMNNNFTVEDRIQLRKDMSERDVTSKTLLNRYGEQCVFTYAKLQNSNYYVITTVPTRNFADLGHYYHSVAGAVGILSVLFVADAVYMIFLNKKLKISMAEEKSANSTKSDFLSRMSHDIRTPMNGVMGMLDIAEKNLDDKEKLKENFAKIKQSSQYLLSLVNDILDMNKLENGNVELRNESVDLKAIYEDCLAIVKPQIKEKNLTLKTYIQEDIHNYVLGSQLHIRQLMLNLLSNSIKYNKDNGKVMFTMEESHVIDNKVTIKLSVSDTGIGMSDEFQKKVFEPFSQENQSARTKFGGSGLGMSIVKKIVDLMNGSISVASKVDEGTTFTVFIPFEIDHNSQVRFKKEERVASQSIKGKRVLLVEDNEINMEIAEFILQDKELIVEKAMNGQEAVEKFIMSDRNYYDVIIMDVMMPIMDGHEATRAIRQLSRKDAKTIPIIAMTANAFEEDRKKAFEAGMSEHLAKPINAEKLVDLLNKFLCSK